MNPTPPIPSAVKSVLAAMQASAKAAGLGAKSAYAYHYTGAMQPFDRDEWIVGCRYENGMPSMIYRKGEWFYRSAHTGEDTPIKHGQAGAEADAAIAFTG